MTETAKVPRTAIKQIGTNWPWNWKLTVLKIIKMVLVRPPMTSFKMTVRADCAVSAWSPLSLHVRALASWLLRGWGESTFGQTVCFLSTNLASLLAIRRWAAGPYFRLQCQAALDKQSKHQQVLRIDFKIRSQSSEAHTYVNKFILRTGSLDSGWTYAYRKKYMIK